MENELTIRQQNNLVSVVSENGIGEVIKPLTREIHLFDSFIAGTTHLKKPEVLDKIQVGDKLILRREENRFDDNAILVLNKEKEKLGYVPEKDNIIFARLLDAGKMLGAQIKNIDQKGTFKRISIGIYLIDF